MLARAPGKRAVKPPERLRDYICEEQPQDAQKVLPSATKRPREFFMFLTALIVSGILPHHVDHSSVELLYWFAENNDKSFDLDAEGYVDGQRNTKFIVVAENGSNCSRQLPVQLESALGKENPAAFPSPSNSLEQHARSPEARTNSTERCPNAGLDTGRCSQTLEPRTPSPSKKRQREDMTLRSACKRRQDDDMTMQSPCKRHKPSP